MNNETEEIEIEDQIVIGERLVSESEDEKDSNENNNQSEEEAKGKLTKMFLIISYDYPN